MFFPGLGFSEAIEIGFPFSMRIALSCLIGHVSLRGHILPWMIVIGCARILFCIQQGASCRWDDLFPCYVLGWQRLWPSVYCMAYEKRRCSLGRLDNNATSFLSRGTYSKVLCIPTFLFSTSGHWCPFHGPWPFKMLERRRMYRMRPCTLCPRYCHEWIPFVGLGDLAKELDESVSIFFRLVLPIRHVITCYSAFMNPVYHSLNGSERYFHF